LPQQTSDCLSNPFFHTFNDRIAVEKSKAIDKAKQNPTSLTGA